MNVFALSTAIVSENGRSPDAYPSGRPTGAPGLPPTSSMEMPSSEHRGEMSMQSPSLQGGVGRQHARLFATSVTLSGSAMSHRVSAYPSSRITAPGSWQSWVTRKMMSGVQSHHGHHGHHGQMRSCASSGAFGSFSSSEVRI